MGGGGNTDLEHGRYRLTSGQEYHVTIDDHLVFLNFCEVLNSLDRYRTSYHQRYFRVFLLFL